ncbi:MAG: NADP-dependent phosphogluconate dehydrogenase [Acidobacteria bacterium]|nr:MAG: NADP-dependent phosphogluconate dehydrogenase [Acidobacteriota bacterium]
MTARDERPALGAFGLVGLGVMGLNLARNMIDHGVSVVAWDIDRERVARFGREEPAGRAVGAEDLEDLVARLPRPRRILVMVPAGRAVDSVLDRLAPLLDRGDVVIDGGNSYYGDTERRQRSLDARGVSLVGLGVSGGEEGARHGPSLMAGGDLRAYQLVAPVLEAIAARSGHGPCVARLGPGGAGHFVKMVHNGIEYGDMQVIAEIYDLARRGLGLAPAEVADLFDRFGEGRLASFLTEAAAAVLRATHVEQPLVDAIVDEAGQKGTGRWTARDAIDMGEAVPTLTAAVDARVLSSAGSLRRALAARLGTPAGPVELAPGDLEQAFFGARLCAYAQGFRFIRLASDEHGWGIDPGTVTRVWRAGCIIRAALLDRIAEAFAGDPELPHLFLHPPLAREIGEALAGWRRTAAAAASAGIPAPAIASSLAYVDALRSERLPQSLTQGQRDYFGAHGFRLRGDPEDAPLRHGTWRR